MRVVRLTIMLVGRRMQWVAPAVALITWYALVFTDTGPATANTTTLFIAHVVLLCWLTVLVGNVDDDAHRDVLSASLGSARRLHVARLVTALVIAVLAGGFGATATTLFSVPVASKPAVITAVGAYLLAGGLLGVSVGTFLHRPHLRHLGATIIVGAVGVVAVIVAPPIQRALRDLDHGRLSASWRILAIGVVAVAIAGVLAADFASRRSR